jgi:N-acetyl-anhydromuramyl-L-alanine amidase AmpD
MHGAMITARLRTIPAVACVWAALLAGGCTMHQKPLAELPVHDLDLSAPGPATRTAPKAPVVQERPAAVGSDPWAVRKPRAWRYIVIHHSATDNGNASEFDTQHRKRGWDELGYHFVIDNGRGGPDGRVEVGSRWKRQKTGAHTGGTPRNEYNEYGIGICLVGDFRGRLPSAAQLASLRELVSTLVERYHIPPENIIGHCDAPNANTQCPGSALYRYVLDSLRPHVRPAYASRE